MFGSFTEPLVIVGTFKLSITKFSTIIGNNYLFSALKWLGNRKGIRPVKSWVVMI